MKLMKTRAKVVGKYICFYPLGKKAARVVESHEEIKRLDDTVGKVLERLSAKHKTMLNDGIWNEINDEFYVPIPVTNKGNISGFFHPDSFSPYQHTLINHPGHHMTTSEFVEWFVQTCLEAQEDLFEVTPELFNDLIQKMMPLKPKYEAIKEKIQTIYTLVTVKKLDKFIGATELGEQVNRFLTLKVDYDKDFHFFNETCHHHSSHVKRNKGELHLQCTDCGIEGEFTPNTKEFKLSPQFSIRLEKEEKLLNKMEETFGSFDIKKWEETATKFANLNQELKEKGVLWEACRTKQKNLEKEAIIRGATVDRPDVFSLYETLWKLSIPKRKKGEAITTWFTRAHQNAGNTDKVKLFEQILTKLEKEAIPSPCVYLPLLKLELAKQEDIIKRNGLATEFTFGEVKMNQSELRDFLACINRMDGAFGLTTYAEMFSGSRSEKMNRYRLNKNQQHGLLAGYPYEKIRIAMEELITRGITEKRGYEYPKYHVTTQGKTLLKVLDDELKKPSEERYQDFLNYDFSKFEKEMHASHIPREWVVYYTVQHLGTQGPKGFQHIIELLKKKKNEAFIEEFEPLLAQAYDEKYKPVLSFIRKKQSDHPLFLEMVTRLLKGGKK